jgi:AraC-like DNA-binding protein
MFGKFASCYDVVRSIELGPMVTEQAQGPSPLVERADSLRTWSDVIRHRFVTLQIAPHKSLDRGSVHTRHVGPLQAAAVSSEPQTFIRTQRQTATAGDPDLLALGMVESGVGYLEQDGRTCEVANGAFALYETSRPFTWTMTGDWTLCVYTWPRESIALTEVQSQRLTAATVSRSAGLGRFLGPMLSELIRCDAGLSVPAAVKVANEIAEMSIIAAGDIRPADCTDGGPEKVREIQLFIEQNLGDPALTPAAIAQEFYMSTRTLHRLFGQSGLTVAAWIKHRRLDACRRALLSPSARTVPISDIAARYGFTNQAFFSREFAAEYQLSPSKYREAGGFTDGRVQALN